MADRVLDALEWAGKTSTASAGVEAIKALSVICVDKNITQETMHSASDKIQAHKKIPLEDLFANTSEIIAPSTSAAPSVLARSLGSQLSRLTRPLGSAAYAGSKSSSFAKQLPVSSHMQPHRGRQEESRMHLAAADAPRRVTQALCELVEGGELSVKNLECAFEGVKLAQRCNFPVHEMYWNFMRLVRHVAWEAAHSHLQSDLVDEVAVASKSAAAHRLILSILEMEGGARELHFRRNVEVMLLSHMFADDVDASAPLISLKSDLFSMALSLITKMMNRVVADGVRVTEQAASVHDDALDMLAQASRQVPKISVLHEGCGWDCTQVYSAHTRLSVLMSVAGERILIRLFGALGSAFEKPCGTHFTCFTGTKVQILTQQARATGTPSSSSMWPLSSPSENSSRESKSRTSAALGIAPFGPQFTCFTGTQVQILTQKAPLGAKLKPWPLTKDSQPSPLAKDSPSAPGPSLKIAAEKAIYVCACACVCVCMCVGVRIY
jgi:hypothetical protein